MGTWHPKEMGRQGTKEKRGVRERGAQERGKPKNQTIGSELLDWSPGPSEGLMKANLFLEKCKMRCI